MFCETDPLMALLAFIDRRPLLPPSYIARVLDQSAAELQIRLDVCRRMGWLTVQQSCCGRGECYALTDAGRALIA